MRSYLMAVRLIDTPREPDIFLPNVMGDVLAFPVTADSHQLVGRLLADYWESQHSETLQIADGEGEIGPRLAFELITYGGQMHADVDKERRLDALGDEFRALVYLLAHDYAIHVTDLAMMVRSVARDDPATTTFFEPAPRGTPTAAEIIAARGPSIASA